MILPGAKFFYILSLAPGLLKHGSITKKIDVNEDQKYNISS